MKADVHVFKIEDQWQMIHIPKKPNGFGIFIIGDVNHFVYNHKSLWTQSLQRESFVDSLLDEGYTVFYSNLYGRHWGSPDAVNLALKVYEVVLRCVTINSKIHIFAEGMGGLIALQLIKKMPTNIRSIALINPCINLPKHIENEKEKKIFFKSLHKEISVAYHKNADDAQITMNDYRLEKQKINNTPIKIWHHINHIHYPLQDHSRLFEQLHDKEGLTISLLVPLADKNVMLSEPIIHFFNGNENIL